MRNQFVLRISKLNTTLTVERFEKVFSEFIIEGCGLTSALSSRGLGRGPLKAQTRVRIPLALFEKNAKSVDRAEDAELDGRLILKRRPLGSDLFVRPHRLSVRTAPFHGAERGSIPLGAMLFWGIRLR